MPNLYLVSTSSFSGKSALAIGLGKRFIGDGFTVGYMKPVGTTMQSVAGCFVDEDASFAQEVFGLSASPQDLAPLTLNSSTVEDILSHPNEERLRRKLLESYAQVAQGKDVVILEGAGNLAEGCLAGLCAREVAKLFQAKAIVVAKYSRDLVIDDLLLAKETLGASFFGVMINNIPPMRWEFAQKMVKPFLSSRGVKVLGLLPEKRLLLSTSVKEMASCLGGKLLCCADKVDELVEDLMVGAMGAESALTYFRRRPNKAVITGGDRPDIQLAALQTSTKCLILTGGLYPAPVILGRAEEAGVPMILVSHDTLTTVEMLEQFFGKTRFHQPVKMKLFQELLEEHFDFAAVYAELGLSSKGG